MFKSVNRSLVDQASWYRSLTLAERAKLQGKHILDLDSAVSDAQSRFDKWKAQQPFDSDLLFVQRLATDEICEGTLFQLLKELPDNIFEQFVEPPFWLTQLCSAFSFSDESVFSQIDDCVERFGFLEIIKPLIHKGHLQLRRECQALLQEYPDAPFDIEVAELTVQQLSESLLHTLARTMTLEMNVARLQGLLQGETPRERFQDFTARLKQKDISLTILKEYPVLARQLTTYIDYWVSYRLEVLKHLCIDWHSIRFKFFPDIEPGLLIKFSDGAGDTHKSGRSVVILEFSSGVQIVYKPRSLAVDMHFQNLLNWLNKRGDHPPFRTLKIINRNGYGWVEYVFASDCSSIKDVQRFYTRQGGYLALLYVLQANDFHNENLIAEGEHPVLVDLETLFQPHFGKLSARRSEQPAVDLHKSTVLRVGLLPQRLWSSSEFEGVEISGLANGAGEFWPDRFLRAEATDTDEMRFVRKRLEMPALQNQPKINGAEVNVQDFVEELVDGFTAMYRLLVQYQAELFSEDGPLALFEKDEVRVVLRSTRIYSGLLYESFHPDLLRDALDRDRFFDRLWLDVRYLPILARVIRAEHEALLNGDIPVFTTYPNSLDLWSCTGEKIDKFFDQSGMALVYQRLSQLSAQDLDKQIWVIRSSMAILSPTSEELQKQREKPKYTYKTQIFEPNQLYEHLLDTAKVVGNRLEELALHDKNCATWLGLNLDIHNHWQVVPLGMNLYDGISGVALFLAYLGKVSKEQRYTSLANSALATLQIQLEDELLSVNSIGAFEGLSGIIYTLQHLGTLWNQEDLITQALILVDKVVPLIEEDSQFDIIGGAAGCICTLLSLNRYAPSKKILAVAVRCGDHLIAQAQPMPKGMGWAAKGSDHKALAGFSHGVAGIAWALLELAEASGEARFRSTALESLEYERSLFVPHISNWPDIRNFGDAVYSNDSTQDNCMTAWCHGAPGIGLARLKILSYLENAETRAEINTALKTTLDHGFGNSHCLCHGDLGNLELFLQASLLLKDPKLTDQVDCLTSNILESISKEGFLCGVPMMVETPDLMVGLAGIGYGLLRLAEPNIVPSILTLEPPRKNSS